MPDNPQYYRKYVLPAVAEVVGFEGTLNENQDIAKTQLADFVKIHPEVKEKISAYVESLREEYIEKVQTVYGYGTFDEKNPADKKFEMPSKKELSEGFDKYFLNNPDPYRGISSLINTINIADLTIGRAMALNSYAVAEKITRGEKIDAAETIIASKEMFEKLGTTDPCPDSEGKYSKKQNTSINLFRGASEDEDNPFMYRSALASDYEAMLAETTEIQKAATAIVLGTKDKNRQQEFLEGMQIIADYTGDGVGSAEKTYNAALKQKFSGVISK